MVTGTESGRVASPNRLSSTTEPQSSQRLGPAGFDPARVWSEDLSDAQLRLVVDSSDDDGTSGFGVELRGQQWAAARALVAKDLGWIEGGAPNGSSLPGLYFNGPEGVRVTHEFDDDGEATDAV